MSIQEMRFDDIGATLQTLEEMGSWQNTVFRGHLHGEWRLSTTYLRSRISRGEDFSKELEVLINRYMAGLARVGLQGDPAGDRLYWLEHARHFGLPSPCIDVTYSPYVALFFAFNGVHHGSVFPDSPKYASLYAIRLDALAAGWADHKVNAGNSGQDARAREQLLDRARQGFFDYEGKFQKGFPADDLFFIPFPGSHNARMQRQMGAFIYDSLDYHSLPFADLEDFIAGIGERQTSTPGGTVARAGTATKVLINKTLARQVFEKLEMMGISAGMLYLDEGGAAMDAQNAYFYDSRTLRLRDVGFSG